MRNPMIPLLLVAVAAIAVAAPVASAPGDWPLAGMGDQQARETYAAQCAGCHGEKMTGGQFGPSLRTPEFAERWRGKDDALLKYVATTMPPGAAGTLSEAQNASVVKLILDTAATGGQFGMVGPQPRDPSQWRDETYRREDARQKQLLANIAPVTADVLRAPPASDWLSWRRTADAAGFSPLSQINRSNVGKLRLKWAWSARHGRNAMAPIVRDGVMFINSSFDVEALDAATGTLLWRFSRNVPEQYRGPLHTNQRSMAMLGRLLFVPTADRHLIALDATTGKLVWDTEIVPASMPGAVTSAGPAVAGNVLVQGIAMGTGCDGGCYVMGLDPETGKVLWKTSSVAQPGEPGADSWNGTPPNERSGGAIWIPPSYDAASDRIIYGTAGSYDISRLLRPAGPGQTTEALYTNSTIALDPATGKRIWHHQHLPRDVWDLDEVFERTLASVPVSNRKRDVIVSIGKLGILDVLDRADGKYVYSIDLGLNNVVSAIDPVTGARTIDPARVPTPNKWIEICPSAQGARNWMATSLDAASSTLFVPMQKFCMDFAWTDVPGAPDGRIDMAWALKPAPDADGNFGIIKAVDLATRKVRWEHKTRGVPSSSLLATAGGLLFTGESTRWFRALDQKSGATLWETRLAAAPSATPITFSVDGKQYIAIASGIGGGQSTESEQLTQEEASPSPATTLMVFGL